MYFHVRCRRADHLRYPNRFGFVRRFDDDERVWKNRLSNEQGEKERTGSIRLMVTLWFLWRESRFLGLAGLGCFFLWGARLCFFLVRFGTRRLRTLCHPALLRSLNRCICHFCFKWSAGMRCLRCSICRQRLGRENEISKRTQLAKRSATTFLRLSCSSYRRSFHGSSKIEKKAQRANPV